MKVKTELMKDLVTRVSKGAGNNKLIPITSLVNILVSDDTLFLTTTDTANYFTVRLDNVEGENMEVSVDVDLFTKLVQKITSEYISIELMGSYLMIVGNGKYKIDIVMEEDGSAVKFPEMSVDMDKCTVDTEICKAGIIKIIENNKASLAITKDIPCLMNYYLGDTVITTDRYKICETDIKLFEKPVLLSPATVELLALFVSQNIHVYADETAIAFNSDDSYLYTPRIDDVDKMPVKQIHSLIESDFNSMCKIPKSALMEILDRLALFVSPYDKNGIYLTFAGSELSIGSKKSNGQEVIPVQIVEPFNNYTCCVDIEMLRSQINTIDMEMVEIWFGSDVALKFSEPEVTKIVALMEDDRMEA